MGMSLQFKRDHVSRGKVGRGHRCCAVRHRLAALVRNLPDRRSGDGLAAGTTPQLRALFVVKVAKIDGYLEFWDIEKYRVAFSRL